MMCGMKTQQAILCCDVGTTAGSGSATGTGSGQQLQHAPDTDMVDMLRVFKKFICTVHVSIYVHIYICVCVYCGVLGG